MLSASAKDGALSEWIFVFGIGGSIEIEICHHRSGGLGRRPAFRSESRLPECPRLGTPSSRGSGLRTGARPVAVASGFPAGRESSPFPETKSHLTICVTASGAGLDLPDGLFAQGRWASRSHVPEGSPPSEKHHAFEDARAISGILARLRALTSLGAKAHAWMQNLLRTAEGISR
jgi:hypothetical protein